MSTNLRASLSLNYWRHSLSIGKVAKAVLGSFGTLWLIVEAGGFLFPETVSWFQDHWYVFLLVGLGWTLWENWPTLTVSSRLHGRDVTITITVGDIFDQPGAIVVGSNTSFDTATPDIINPGSVQGQFTRHYYNDAAHLDYDLDRALADQTYERAPAGKPGRDRIYPLGTVAKLRARERNAYLLAIATINEHGNARGSFDDLKVCLAMLWEFVADRGSIEPIAVPVLGTGFSRIKEPRDQIIREMIQSFVAACSARKFCEGLVVVIPPRDYITYRIDLEELGAFLSHVCRYTEQRQPSDRGRGVGIEVAAGR